MSNYFGSGTLASGNAFGVVTVMDAVVYKYSTVKSLIEGTGATPKTIIEALDEDAKATTHSYAIACQLDHLQVATLSTDGPNITIQGGKFNNTLLKYGKTARCEITDALGQADALVNLGGAEMNEGVLSITDKFGEPMTILGHTFVVDKETGKHVDASILMYKFLPDATPSFAFDSGNAATFDLNGDLLAVELDGLAGSGTVCDGSNGVFFSILDNGCSLSA